MIHLLLKGDKHIFGKFHTHTFFVHKIIIGYFSQHLNSAQISKTELVI